MTTLRGIIYIILKNYINLRIYLFSSNQINPYLVVTSSASYVPWLLGCLHTLEGMSESKNQWTWRGDNT